MKKYIFYIILLPILFMACGESPFNLDEEAYEPKIVIDGYLLANQKVNNIRISRNFPLNKEINIYEFPLTQAEVKITDVETSKQYPLSFNIGQLGFEYRGNDLKVENGKSYQLDVSAEIDSKPLSASSKTTVPLNGFGIDRDASTLGSMGYREEDQNGDVKNFSVTFHQSSSTDFYVLSIVALEASPETFIEDSFGDIKIEDLDEDMINMLKYQIQWSQSSAKAATNSTIDILWFSTWFYGRYRVILYAGDENFKLYSLTHSDVQDIDGNLYEPKFNVQGDGIGVFGAAIADTVYFEITQ